MNKTLFLSVSRETFLVMAGIYIHVPFCYTRCSYCDFYKTTDQQLKGEYIKAVRKEIDLNASFFSNEAIKTIYFGGGTPSTLSPDELSSIITHLFKYFTKDTVTELTIEVNPDDVSEAYIKGLLQAGVNRVSMGVQSFYDAHLRKMNRRHNAAQAMNAIRTAQKCGVNNMSIDLIYGLPYMSFEEWKANVSQAIESKVQHISAYHLTFEKGTLYYDYLKKGTLKEVPEESSIKQFEYLVDQLTKAGYDNYEISNFALPGYYSQHNSNYWTGEKYLGLGPSAHAFNGKQRIWNVRDLNRYCKSVMNDEAYFEKEELSVIDRYNETIMLGLRTKKGFVMKAIEQFDNSKLQQFFKTELKKQLALKTIEIIDGYCAITSNQRFVTDRIISEFFYLNED